MKLFRKSVDLPPPLREAPTVRAAEELADRARAAEVGAEAVLAAAQGALAAWQAEAERRALDNLAADVPLGADFQEGERLAADVAAAESGLALAQRVRDTTTRQLEAALGAADLAAAAPCRELLREAVLAVAKAVEQAGAANARLVELAAAVAERAPSLAPILDGLRFHRLPNAEQLAEALSERLAMLAEPAAPDFRANVLVAFTERHGTNQPGDRTATDAVTAYELLAEGVAELVDPADAERVGAARLVSFTDETQVRLIQNWNTQGRHAPEGSVMRLPPKLAARLVNTGFARAA